MDKLQLSQKQEVEQISYNHSVSVLGGNISVVFFDVTTVYFEIEQEDELRKLSIFDIARVRKQWLS